MKKIKLNFLVAIFSVAIFSVSCKKTTSDTTQDDIAEAKVHTEDASTFDGETESVDDDINNTVAVSSKLCGISVFPNTPGANHLPFDLDTTNSSNSQTRIVLTFNGNTSLLFPCRRRTGTITIDLINGVRWVETGSILRYTFTNFKVEDMCRHRSITLNGERFVTNVNGGNLYRLKMGNVNSLVHKIRTGASGIKADFTDSLGVIKTAYWHVAKRHTIEYTNTALGGDVFYFSIAGDSTINNIPNTAGWGTTRNGKNYQTSISTSIKANTHCKLWKPTAGIVNHTVNSFSASVQYGVDVNGVAVTSGCAAYYKVSWLINGNTGNSIIAYR